MFHHEEGSYSTLGRRMPRLPPPYEAVLYDQLWAVAAPFVHPNDLYSACLVSRLWHKVFAPLLWANPADRFGRDSDAIYLSITRFKRLLPRARLEVKRLAHTLYIPPAQPEFYGGPQDGWLRDIMDHLPSLQSLIVSNLSFFDHHALHCHRSPAPTTRYSLKLLIASECENTTAASLTSALNLFPDLIYLDLSSNHGLRNPSVLRQINSLSQLRVLKLRNCGLRDYDVEVLTFGSCLRSLDVSDNYLTERGVANLLERLHPPSIDSSNLRRLKSRRPTLRNFVAEKLTSGVNGHHYIDDGMPSAFADLHLAGNFLTIDNLSRVLRCSSVEYLDCGSLNCSQRSQELLSPGSPGSDRSQYMRGEVNVLNPAYFIEAFQNIRSLRIHYSVVTNHPFSGKELPVEEVCFELHGDDLRYELDSIEVVDHGLVFELDDTSLDITDSVTGLSVKDAEAEVEHPGFESPEDVGTVFNQAPPIVLQDVGIDPGLKVSNQVTHSEESERPITQAESRSTSSQKRRPPKLVISPNYNTASAHPKLAPSYSAPPGPEAFKYSYTVGPDNCRQAATQNGHKAATTQEIIDEIRQRRLRTEARERLPGRFKPSMLPNLKTLTLTDIPTTTRRQNVIDPLILFMQECAEEEELARLEESLHSQAPQGLLKLQRLILEISSVPETIENPGSPREKRHSFTKSSTEDQDSETFMAATECDFTFFGEDDGGLLVSEGRIDAPIRVGDGMIVCGEGWAGKRLEHAVDVVGALAGWRRERMAVWEAAEWTQKNCVETAMIGHWRGEVNVVR